MARVPKHIEDAPAVLGACVPISKATARHGAPEQRARGALMLVSALAIIPVLALRPGWREDQVRPLPFGTSYFVNCAAAELDVPAPAALASEGA